MTFSFKYLVCCAALILALSTNYAVAIEEAKYTVIEKKDAFELRKYAPNIIAETLVNSSFEESGNMAFRRLFKYISGDNQAKQEIAMTAPVKQTAEKIAMTAPVSQREQDNGQWLISFMLPASYTLATAPKPNNALVVLKQNPARHVAAITYSGRWTEKNYLKHKQQLENWIKENKLTPTAKPIWARYNAPLTPWFLRRNEVLIPVSINTSL